VGSFGIKKPGIAGHDGFKLWVFQRTMPARTKKDAGGLPNDGD